MRQGRAVMMSGRNGLWLAVVVLLLVIGAGTAYLELFSTFMPYDDEGVIMLSNRLFLSGYTPYRDISWLYGPTHIAQVELVHDVLGVPVTHSAARYATLLNWMLLCMFASLLLCWLSRSLVWGLVAGVVTFLYTGSVVNEPGHPQVWLTAVGLLLPLCMAISGRGRPVAAWLMVGCLTAVAFHTKINAGVFFGSAVAVVLLAQWPWDQRTLLLAGVLATGSFAFPFLLMAPLLTADNSLGFALISAASMAGVALLAVARPLRGHQFYRCLIACFIGFVIVSVLALVYASVHGIGVLDMAASLRAYAAEQQSFYHFFRDYSWLQIALALLALGCAVLQLLAPGAALTSLSVILARVLFVGAALYSLAIDDAGHSHYLLGYAGPWCWLVIVGHEREQGRQAGRLLLAALAAWSPLLAYPIPGTQLYMGSLPILLVALVCLTDMLTQVIRAQGARGQTDKWLTMGGVAVLLVVTIALVWQLQAARRHYAVLESLALPGTGALRIEPGRAGMYRSLVAAAESHDMLLTTFRFNSLYLWSGAGIPGPEYLSQASLRHAPEQVQASIRQTLQQADRPLVITRRGAALSAAAEDSDHWLYQDFKAYHQIGPYSLLRPSSP